jgi:hypothetical protein
MLCRNFLCDKLSSSHRPEMPIFAAIYLQDQLRFTGLLQKSTVKCIKSLLKNDSHYRDFNKS